MWQIVYKLCRHWLQTPRSSNDRILKKKCCSDYCIQKDLYHDSCEMFWYFVIHVAIRFGTEAKAKTDEEVFLWKVQINSVIFISRHRNECTNIVVNVEKIEERSGLYSPVLVSGSFPIVDGMVTSSDAIHGVKTLRLIGSSTHAICKMLGACDVLATWYKGAYKSR